MNNTLAVNAPAAGGALTIELLSDEDLASINGGGPLAAGALLLAGGAVALVAGAVIGAAVYVVVRAIG